MSGDNGPLALGGGQLCGDRWVRMLYLDEAGIGKIDDDPFLVVAGVLIHADTQWSAIVNDLKTALLDATPFGVKTPAYFHAKDVFHGSGEFPRDKWPREVRTALLEKVGSIPYRYQVPVLWSAIDRRAFAKDHPGDTPRQHLTDAYSVAALTCFLQAEAYMRGLPNQAEVASVVLEQNHELQRRLPEILDLMNHPEDEPGLDSNFKHYVPFQKIIDGPSSQPKSLSSLLQVADYCAFAIKRWQQKAPQATALTGVLAPQLLLFREAAGPKTSASWNPVFMPQMWGGRKIDFDPLKGKFVLSAE